MLVKLPPCSQFLQGSLSSLSLLMQLLCFLGHTPHLGHSHFRSLLSFTILRWVSSMPYLNTRHYIPSFASSEKTKHVATNHFYWGDKEHHSTQRGGGQGSKFLPLPLTSYDSGPVTQSFWALVSSYYWHKKRLPWGSNRKLYLKILKRCYL